jgi:hypothetical protein
LFVDPEAGKRELKVDDEDPARELEIPEKFWTQRGTLISTASGFGSDVELLNVAATFSWCE